MDLIRVRMNVLMKKIKNIKKTSMIHWSDFAIRSYPFLSLGLQLVRVSLYQSDCRQARCILMSNTPSYTGIHTRTHTKHRSPLLTSIFHFLFYLVSPFVPKLIVLLEKIETIAFFAKKELSGNNGSQVCRKIKWGSRNRRREYSN